jgi:hypothetical protein
MPALAAAGDPPPDGGACRFGRNAAPVTRPPAAHLVDWIFTSGKPINFRMK